MDPSLVTVGDLTPQRRATDIGRERSEERVSGICTRAWDSAPQQTRTVAKSFHPMRSICRISRRNMGMRVLPRRGLLCVVGLGYVQQTDTDNTMMIQIAFLAWIFLDESLGIPEIVGIVLVSMGVFLTQAISIRRQNAATTPT